MGILIMIWPLLALMLIPFEFVLLRRIYYNWRSSGVFNEKLKTILCVVAIIITIYLLFSNDYRKSKVDISPMAELSVKQVYMLEDTIKQLEEHDFITRFDATDMPTNPRVSMIYSFTWQNPDSGKGVRVVSGSFYLEEQEAINRLRSEAKGMHRTIKNDNNTEAVLCHSRMYRNEYFIPDLSRSLYSYIRFGNAVIIISEHLEYNELHLNASSEFIKWICELLKDDVPQQPT